MTADRPPTQRDTKRRWNPIIYHYGAGLGLPYAALERISDLYDLAPFYGDYRRRREIARNIRVPAALRIHRKTGFRMVEMRDLPRLSELLDAAQQVYAARAQGWDVPRDRPYTNILSASDLDSFPVFLDVAMGAPLVSSAAEYLGVLPQLRYVELWVSPAHGDDFGSMLYHLDMPDAGVVSVFINVGTVIESTGPTTFIPADVCAPFLRDIGYYRRYIRGQVNVGDGLLQRKGLASATISLVGGPGTAVLVDTSSALHQGGRCRKGTRLILTIKYNRPFKIGLPGDTNLKPFIDHPASHGPHRIAKVLDWPYKDPLDDLRHPLVPLQASSY